MFELRTTPIVSSKNVILTIFTDCNPFRVTFGDREYYCTSPYSVNRLIGLARRCLTETVTRLTFVNGVELTFTFHYTISKPTRLLKK